jgi:glutamate dehydrogenase (NAD(P)+)
MERRARERQEFVLTPEPQLRITYRDPITPAQGFLVIDTLAPGIAYGGVRIAKELNWKQLAPLARIGTVRYQLARANLSGAKCGLMYDPQAPDRLAVLERFLRSLRPYLDTVVSLGPDVNVSEEELDQVIGRIGMTSRMTAVARAQGWAPAVWDLYRDIMHRPLLGETVRDLQVPLFTAHAIRNACQMLLPKQPVPRVAVIGIGPFGRRVARLIARQGGSIVALANSEMACHAPEGLSLEQLDRVTEDLDFQGGAEVELLTYHEALRVPYDVLVLAGKQRLGISDVGKVDGRLVIEAAQQTIAPQAEYVLIDRGIDVVPNFAVSIGAIILSDAIRRGVATEVDPLLTHLADRARTTMLEICRLAEGTKISLRDASLRVAFRKWEWLPPVWSTQNSPILVDGDG